MTRLSVWLMGCVLALPVLGAPAADPDYVTSVEKWRADFDADVRTGGWLTLVGRVELREGSVRVGSARGSSIVLPPHAPKHFGVLVRQGERFSFTPAAGTPVSIDGAQVMSETDVKTRQGTGKIRSGSFELHVRRVGDDYYLLAIDEQAPAIAAFKGTSWYPIDPAYRIPARFEAYAQPQKVRVPMTHVSSTDEMDSTGDVEFELAGHSIRLKTFIDEDQLFVMFQDGTNGRDTYGGGRFVHAPLPKDGATVLDFNKAFNPYCSLNDNIMCPIPPAENRLDLSVSAGEKFGGRER